MQSNVGLAIFLLSLMREVIYDKFRKVGRWIAEDRASEMLEMMFMKASWLEAVYEFTGALLNCERWLFCTA